MQNDTQHESISVFVIDSCLTTLWGLERLIESANGTMTLIGSAISWRVALEQVKKARPSVILLSTVGSGVQCLDGIPSLQEGSGARILVLLPKRDLALQEKAIFAGARGIVDSEGRPERVLTAITKIYEGEMWLNRVSITRIVDECMYQRSGRLDPEQRKIASLTARERHVVAAVATHPGATAKFIAELLNISAHTARNHLNAVYEKLQVANRVELFDYAQRHGLCDMDVPANGRSFFPLKATRPSQKPHSSGPLSVPGRRDAHRAGGMREG